MLASTDNDYSVTRHACSVQRDLYSRPLPAGGFSCIRCDIGIFTTCLSSRQLTRPNTRTTSNCVTLSR